MIKQEASAPSGGDGGGADEFDELTIDDLRSLLDNFKNLSKAEQMDLIQYMRKLETTDPDKVKQLKSSSGDGDGSTGHMDSRYKNTIIFEQKLIH